METDIRIGIPFIPTPGPELATPMAAAALAGQVAAAPDTAALTIVGGGRQHEEGSPVGGSFPLYARWRVTKCKPRDLDVPAEDIEEKDQAIHELVGECAELGELWNENGLDLFRDPALIARLADEVGDAFFCASWAIDAWVGDASPLRAWPLGASTELITDDEAKVGRHLGIVMRAGAADRADVSFLFTIAQSSIIALQTNAGLLSNSFKKLKFQRRPQDAAAQVDRAMVALTYCNHLLAMAGLRVDDALARNVTKLDARYPGGYVPGQGGGDRTGAGR